MPARGVWGHALPGKFFWFLTFWDHLWCNLGVKLQKLDDLLLNLVVEFEACKIKEDHADVYYWPWLNTATYTYTCILQHLGPSLNLVIDTVIGSMALSPDSAAGQCRTRPNCVPCTMWDWERAGSNDAWIALASSASELAIQFTRITFVEKMKGVRMNQTNLPWIHHCYVVKEVGRSLVQNS